MKKLYGLKIEENSLIGTKAYNKLICSNSALSALLDSVTTIVKEQLDKTPSFDVNFLDSKTIMLRWDIPYYCTEIIISVIEEKTV